LKPAKGENRKGNNQKTIFEVTQMVHPKSNPDLIGTVIEIIPGEPENIYMIFLNGISHPYYESQLEAKRKT